MKITKIASQVKNASRYSIFVDEKYSFSLSADQLLEQRIAVGDELAANEVKKLKKLSADDKIYNAALNYIAIRPRSRWEIESYLARKKASPELAEQIIKKLEKLDLINDEAFARAWIENRKLLNPRSHRKLVAELRAKRISDEVITKVLEKNAEEEREILKLLVERKRHQTKYKDDLKLAQYLSRQGFNYEDIKQILYENP